MMEWRLFVVALKSAMALHADEDLFRGNGFASASRVEEKHPVNSSFYC